MIFLIGTQGSGTSWVRDCFSQVCRAAALQELHLLELYERISQHVRSYTDQSEEEALVTIRKVSAAAWRALLDGVQPGVELSKNTYPGTSALAPLRPDLHPYAVRLVREVISDAQTVIVVRDPRAAFCATVNYLNHYRPNWGGSVDPVEFAQAWQLQNTIWLNDRPTAFFKYEDLKQNFIGTLTTVFASCGIACSSEVFSRIVAQEYTPRNGEPGHHSDSVDGFSAQLKPSVIRQIEGAAENLMTFLDYRTLS
ncbi:MAG: hypothetical protein FD152_256 [Xanthobacteraceae bacterium]|nr:MAG: hypothetical protein FD152_256 [Xanthobacteraceae bacterium]